jgi:hypothetical protein
MCGRRDTCHNGAIIFIDADRNGAREDGEAVLRVLPALPRGSCATGDRFAASAT